MERKNKAGEIKVHMTIEQFNSFLSVLSAYEIADEENYLSQIAVRIRNKVMKYGREFEHDGVTYIAVCFYPEESAMLLKLFVIYNHAIEEPTENFYNIFHRNKLNRA